MKSPAVTKRASLTQTGKMIHPPCPCAMSKKDKK